MHRRSVLGLASGGTAGKNHGKKNGQFFIVFFGSFGFLLPKRQFWSLKWVCFLLKKAVFGAFRA